MARASLNLKGVGWLGRDFVGLRSLKEYNITGWVHLPGFTHDVTWAEYKQIRNTENLLDKDVMIKRAHGFSDTIPENAEKVLRLPQG